MTASSLRYRLYVSWGLSAVDVARIILFTTLTLWLGILAVGGTVLVLDPLDMGAIPGLDLGARPLGLLLLALPLAYLLLGLLRRRPLESGRGNCRWVRPRLALPQLAVERA